MASSKGFCVSSGSPKPSTEGGWDNWSQNAQHPRAASAPWTHMAGNQGPTPPQSPNIETGSSHNMEERPSRPQQCFDPTTMRSPTIRQPSTPHIWSPPSCGSAPSMSSHTPLHEGLHQRGGHRPPPMAAPPTASLFPAPFPPLPPAQSYHQYNFDQVFMTRAPPPPPRPPPPPPPKRIAPPHAALVPQQIRRPRSHSPSARARKRARKGSLKNVSNTSSDATTTSSTGSGNGEPDASVTGESTSTDETSDQNRRVGFPLSLGDKLQPRMSRKGSRVYESSETVSVLSSDEGGSGSGGDQDEGTASSGYEEKLPTKNFTSLKATHDPSSKMEGFETSNCPHIRMIAAESNERENTVPDDNGSKSSGSASSVTNDPFLAASPVQELEDTATPQDVPSKAAPAKTLSKSRKALELMREKLELAKQRKLELQDRLQQQKNQGKSVEPPKHAQAAALPRARARLLGALKNREKALQRMESQTLPPISALRADLMISNISLTGTEAMVRIPSHLYDDKNSPDAVIEYEQHPPQAPGHKTEDLAARKNKLEQDLGALKLRLERKQKAASGKKQPQQPSDMELKVGDTIPDKKVKSVLSKEELERRKVEAQAFVDVSYLKHFVSKQRHLLKGVTKQVKDNAKAREECDTDLAGISQTMTEVASRIEDLEVRQRIVSDMLMDSVAKLLNTRSRLYGQHVLDDDSMRNVIDQNQTETDFFESELSSEFVTAAASGELGGIDRSAPAASSGQVSNAESMPDDASGSSGQFGDPL